MKFHITLAIGTGLALLAVPFARSTKPLLIAPLYIEYATTTATDFANQVAELKRRIGPGSSQVTVGFSTFLGLQFEEPELDKPIDRNVIRPTLDNIDLIVERARLNHIPVHISVMSNFFHGFSALREAAIRDDVRNAQWFADGWIAAPEAINNDPAVPRSAWVTPSRYAQPLRQRIEESVRMTGERLAQAMEQFPDVLVSISGDSEVELSYERTLQGEGARRSNDGKVFYADYSPFMVAEFRDSLRTRYAGDASPGSDDNHDGHTFNQDFRQHFRTWQLRYFNDSGPIPYDQYRSMPSKLPESGPYFVDDGFDAPRSPSPGNPFWETWKAFRIRVIANYLHDFGVWLTNDSRISATRFYTHQIPADYVFARKNTLRLETSASPLETAFMPVLASSGVTVFDMFSGKTHTKTSNPAMFRRLEQSGSNWGILEYNPSIPAVGDEDYYLHTLRSLYAFQPSIISPFAWTNAEMHKQYRIQDTAFEHALKKFLDEIRRR